jgi:cation diffusion facilitator family transporter
MYGEKVRAALSSVFAGLVLTALKLAAGLMTGSLGLLAEAAHSLLDFGSAVMTLFAVRSSWRPPDAEHHFGHAKIENLTALAEALLLVLTSVWILFEAAHRLIGRGPEVDPSVWAFLVMATSIVVDVVRSRDLARVAKQTGSQALEADALHFGTDIASSAVVVLGLVCVWAARRFTIAFLSMADPLAASVVAAIILLLSVKLGQRAIDMLIDRAPAGLDAQVQETIREVIRDAPRAPVRLRQAGDQVFAEIDLTLRAGLPVAEGERLSNLIRHRLQGLLGANTDVVVQLTTRPPAETSLRERVATAVAMEGVRAHNITIRQDERGVQADLHLELSGDISLGHGHATADRVERRILREVPEVNRVDIHLELFSEHTESATSLEPEATSELERRIRAIAQSVAGADAVHDVMLSRTSGGLYLSCHCFLPPETLLKKAHSITDQLERVLKEKVPELTRVAVHAEPRGVHV